MPQYAGADVPTWLEDYNGAMTSIDTNVGANTNAVKSMGKDFPGVNNYDITFETTKFQFQINGEWKNASEADGTYGRNSSNLNGMILPFGYAVISNAEASNKTITGIRFVPYGLDTSGEITFDTFKTAALASLTKYSGDTSYLEDIVPLYYSPYHAGDGYVYFTDANGSTTLNINLPANVNSHNGNLKLMVNSVPMFRVG